MQISILGTGMIGANLGRLLALAGHDVFFGSRNAGAVAAVVADAAGSAAGGTVDQAIGFADVVIDALPFGVSLGLPADRLAGKILVTASNYYPDRDGMIDLGGLSQSQALAARLPQTRVVKAFNMLYFKELEARLTGGGSADTAMLLAGDDPAARALVAGLIADSGFDPVDAGLLRNGRLFQTDGPLYAKSLTADEARTRLAAGLNE